VLRKCRSQDGRMRSTRAPRCCPYCQHSFVPSRFRPRQRVCNESDCQRRRHAEYRRLKIASDPLYRQVCLDSPQKWRAEHPGYCKQYRSAHPGAVERNRRGQQLRDRKRRLFALANNTLALDLKHSAAEVWLIGPQAADLANNTLAQSKILIFEPVSHSPDSRGDLANNTPMAALPD
jgi:hypothetical protein